MAAIFANVDDKSAMNDVKLKSLGFGSTGTTILSPEIFFVLPLKNLLYQFPLALITYALFFIESGL